MGRPGNVSTVVTRNVTNRPSEKMRIRTSVISRILQNDQIKRLVNQTGNNNQTLVIPIVHNFSQGRNSVEEEADEAKSSPFVTENKKESRLYF